MAKKFNYPIPGTTRTIDGVVAFPVFVATDLTAPTARFVFAVYANEEDAAKALAYMYGLRTAAGKPDGDKPTPITTIDHTLTPVELAAGLTAVITGPVSRVDDQAAMCYAVAANYTAAGEKFALFAGAQDVTINPLPYSDPPDEESTPEVRGAERRPESADAGGQGRGEAGTQKPAAGKSFRKPGR